MRRVWLLMIALGLGGCEPWPGDAGWEDWLGHGHQHHPRPPDAGSADGGSHVPPSDAGVCKPPEGALPSPGAYDGRHLWDRRVSTPGDDHVASVASDHSGNVLVLGWFEAATGMGSSTIHSYLVKFDRDGGTRASINYTPTRGFLQGLEVAVDDARQVTFTARFSGEISLAGTLFVHEATPDDPHDVLLVKTDEQGLVLWARQFDEEDLGQLAVASSGRSYLSGPNLLVVTTAAGVEVRRHQLASPVMPPFPDADPPRFVVTDIAVDTRGDVVLTGQLRWFALPGVPPSLDELGPGFLIKYAREGHQLWAKQWRRARPRALAIDPGKNIFVSAVYFDGAVILDGTVLPHESGMFFAKVAGSDGALAWVHASGPTPAVELGAASDRFGNFTAVGTITSTVSIAGREFVVPTGQVGLFLIKFDPCGGVLWHRLQTGSILPSPLAATDHPSGATIVTGTFSGTVSLGGAPITAEGPSDGFVVKYGR
jgi:hypothetical protein